MTAFTHYWAGPTCDHYFTRGLEGQPLDHAAGNRFSQRGVKAGSTVFVVNITDGQLHLIGRLTVDKLVHTDAEARKLIGYEPWSASDHVIAKPRSATPMRFQRTVPLPTVKALRFVTPSGKIVPLKFVSGKRLDGQTLRGVRQLTIDSARLLDGIIAES